jgi:DNA-binding SARP family transcriptional activator/LysM repeat protein
VDPKHHQRESPRIRLVVFCALLLLSGAGLGVTAGPPRLPLEAPALDALLQVLAGATLPLDGLVLLLLDLAWMVLAWCALSLVLELAVVGAELLAQGRTWVGPLRRIVDRISLPLARRTVAAAFAVQLLSRGVSIAAAQTLPPPTDTVALVQPFADTANTRDNSTFDNSASTYLVRPGDTLWTIAEQAYGSGAAYRRLVDANLGRRMPDGRVFSAQGVIQPGWRLVAPGATWDVEIVDGQRWYTVRQGDTLSSIAETVLGDRERWSELFDLNRGARDPDETHTLEDADTIWPGLRLQLPDADPATADADTDDAPLPDINELHVAAAPSPEPTEAPPTPTASPTEAPDPTPQPTLEPLVRTSHALQPVVLDPADSPPDTAPSADSTDPTTVDPAASVPAVPTRSPLPLPPLALGGLGLASAAGLVFSARRIRRRFRPLSSEPETEIVVEGGFAQPELARDLTRGLHGVGFDPLVALVAQLQLFVDESHLTSVGVVAVRHGRSSTTLSLRCGLAEQPMLVDLAPAFAERLDAECEACVSADQDVLFRLVRLRKTRLLPSADAIQTTPCLVPLGVLYDRQTYAAAWDSVGHVLIASLPGHGADTILSSLVATLTSRRSPEQLHVWMLAPPRCLPAPLFELPHLIRNVDPSDAEVLGPAMDDLRVELDRRAHRTLPAPDLLVVIPELASLGEHAATLALLAGRALDLGVRFAVASTDPDEAAASPLTPHFGTRMVLRMQTEEASVALLGVADAAFLGGGGRLLLRLDGREPVELYGYQVAPEHLERLVRVMRSAYPIAAPTPPAPPEIPPLPPPPPPSDPEVAPPVLLPETTLAPATALSTDTPAPPMSAPPIQVLCFGHPRVLCNGETVWPRAGGDSKPWELLLFLACQPPEGATRDAVLAALWADDDLPEDAAHRVRQLRYRLRRQLQQVADAPETDGIHFDRRGLKFDPGIVYSDACEFLALIRGTRLTPTGPELVEQLERARALYVGDLLEGPDARRYVWLDERGDSGVTLREHFRRLFQNATIRLADAFAETGNHASAIELYRELTDMDPADERLWVSLFQLHARCNNRRQLVAEERRMRQALRDLADDVESVDGRPPDEPGRETIAEFERLLAGLGDPEPVAV